MSEYNWRIAREDDFHPIYALIYNSKQRSTWSVEEIRRRVIIPIFLEQLIVFHDENENLCGFLTYAMMDGESACHQSSIGISAQDWRSGEQLWLVDFFAPLGGGDKMLLKMRNDVCDVIKQPMRYFRLKQKKIRRISI